MLKYAHRKWQLISALLYNYLCQADKAGQQLFLTKITQATAVATFLVLSISFSYHFGGKTQSFAGWAAVLKGWFSLSSVWRWGCCLTYLFFFSLLIQVNPMHHSPLSPSRTAPRGMPWDDPKQEHGMGNHIVLLQVGVTAFCSSLAHKIQVLLLLHQLPASAWSQIFSHVTREAFLAKYISLSLMERSWDYVSSYLALQSWLFDPCLGVLSPFYQGLLNLSRDVHHPGASRKVSIMYDESAHVSCRRNDQLMDERCESSCSHLGSLLVPPPWREDLPRWCGTCKGKGLLVLVAPSPGDTVWVLPGGTATIGFWVEGKLNGRLLWSMVGKPRGPGAADDTGEYRDEIKSSSSFPPVPWGLNNPFFCNAASTALVKPLTTAVWAGRWMSFWIRWINRVFIPHTALVSLHERKLPTSGIGKDLRV